MNSVKMAVVVSLAVIGLCLTGCKKKEQPTPPAKPATEGMMKQAATTAEEANKTAASAAAEVEQTVCPVTGEKIDKNIFVVYKGKKVYFCMESCKAAFEKDPEKYIAKLPQFAK